MKNLYKKGKVHPSPPSVADHLALLPATILALTAALSPEDKEVLAYLISCCGNTAPTNCSGHRRTTHKSSYRGGGKDHCPRFDCNCFRCYTSFWARWDTSPNRQVIHEIIEAYEEGLFRKKRKSIKKGKDKRVCDELKDEDNQRSFEVKDELGELQSEEPSCSAGENEDVHVPEVELEKDMVTKIVSFIGEKIWGVWNRN